jgi:GNAT superfamily N-acetyltransferase
MEAVRPATPEDGHRLLELAEEFLAAVIHQRGGPLLVDAEHRWPDAATGMARVTDLLADAGSRAEVGTLDQVVVGFAVCHVEDKGGHGRRGVLDACYVEPRGRGVGVGRLLLDGALSWMAEQGCEGVDGTALPGDRAAKNFFESAGFKARVLTMHRQIG